MWVNCCLLRGSTAQTCRGEQPLWFIVQLGSLILTQEFLNSANSIKAAQITKIKFWKKSNLTKMYRMDSWLWIFKFLKIWNLSASKWKNMKSKKDHTKRPQQLASISNYLFQILKKISKHPFFFLHFQLFPLWQAHKLIFGHSKDGGEVRVREVFLQMRWQSLASDGTCVIFWAAEFYWWWL